MTDLYEICESIKKHLPEECRDKLGVEQYDDHSGDIIYDDWGVVSMFEDGTFDNDWINWIDYSDDINFELEDIFEEVGDNLTEIKVKPAEPVENIEKEAMADSIYDCEQDSNSNILLATTYIAQNWEEL